MIEVDVPGYRNLRLEHLVLDFNGTLAIDGRLIDGVADRLERLADKLRISVVTADTFGRVATEMANMPCEITILPQGRQDEAKQQFIQVLGANRCVPVGNGRNDRLMLAEAELGIAVIEGEGAASATLLAADVVAPGICAALDLLLEPLRLVACLRS